MSSQKKSLISTLKTTKKANVASSEVNAKPSNVTSKKMNATQLKRAGTNSMRRASGEFFKR